EYYDRLMVIRTSGDWEGWLRFFLRGVVEVSAEATQTARSILKLREESRQKLANSALGVQLLDHLFERPVITVRAAEQQLGCSYVTAGKLIDELERKQVLKETTGQKRNRVYRYQPYLALFEQQGVETEAPAEAAQVSRSEGEP
ncbi:MAG TPA: Fic family protein, partial [Myxococcaceae bacterium]|nr:Fic family protein [Myxococcaceae bacterium]